MITGSLLNTREVAQRIGVKESTVRAWTSQGVIPHIKLHGFLVRFDAGEIDHWVTGQHGETRAAGHDESVGRLMTRRKEDMQGP